MNWTLLLILITGFVIAAIITYLAESWRYKKFGFSLGSKSHSMWLFTGSLFITLALAALFISYYDLRGNKDTPASLHVERPSAKSPVKKDAPASFRVEHPSAKSSMKKEVISKLRSPPGISSSLPYTIQVGAFKNSQNLDKRSQEIEQLCGMDVFIGKTQIGDTKWNRLFVGHFLTLEEARQTGQSLVRQKIVSNYLVRRIPYAALLGAFSSESESRE